MFCFDQVFKMFHKQYEGDSTSLSFFAATSFPESEIIQKDSYTSHDITMMFLLL